MSDKQGVLGRPRLIQAIRGAQLDERFRRRVLAEDSGGGIARNQVQEQKNDDADADKHRHQRQNTPERVAQHDQ